MLQWVGVITRKELAPSDGSSSMGETKIFYLDLHILTGHPGTEDKCEVLF